MRIRGLSLAIALGSAAALPGCEFDLFECRPSDPGPDRSVREVHGTYVSSATTDAAITWSPSGEEVTFVSADYRIAYARHVLSGAMRQLYASNTPGEGIVDAQLSADGVDWFTTSFNVGDTIGWNVVRRHTSAGSTVLTDRGIGGFEHRTWMRWVLVAPGQPVVAFIVSPDSLFLLRRGGEPTLLGSGCFGIVAFSPDESQVLCPDGTSSLRVFRTDGGAAESLVFPPEINVGFADLIRWGEEGIQVLYWGGDHYLLYEHASGSSRPFTQAPNSPEYTVGVGRVSWSSDGRKVAYWNEYGAQIAGRSCSQGSREYIGGILQGFLYVLDVATGTTTRVAVHTSTEYSLLDSRVAVSPTGSMVAYMVNGGFYLLEVG